MIRLDFNVTGIPLAMRQQSSWVCWFVGNRNGKPTKILVDPRTGRAAKSNDPTTWGTLEAAIARARQRGLGIGYVFSDADNFAGIDFDKCRDLRTGAMAPWAQRIIRYLSSYAEISPSGTGVKLVLIGKFSGRGRRRGSLELYCRKRFFCITGERLPHTPCEPQPRQAELDALMAALFPVVESSTPAKSSAATVTLADAEILERAHAARNGDLFSALWAGRWQHRYGSQSEADLALCSMLSFWTGGDAARVDALFRSSGLSRDKWLEREDYRKWTLAKATQGDIYDARRVA